MLCGTPMTKGMHVSQMPLCVVGISPGKMEPFLNSICGG